MAQLVQHLPRTQNIAGSSPARGSSSFSPEKKELSSGVVACICLVSITDYSCKSHPPSLPPSPPHLINPHVPDDNIVYGGDHLGPGVVAAGAVHHEVGDSDGVGRYVLPPELGGHRVLLPEGPVLVLHVHGKHGRMVAHLWVWGGR